MTSGLGFHWTGGRELSVSPGAVDEKAKASWDCVWVPRALCLGKVPLAALDLQPALASDMTSPEPFNPARSPNEQTEAPEQRADSTVLDSQPESEVTVRWLTPTKRQDSTSAGNCSRQASLHPVLGWVLVLTERCDRVV